MYFTRAHELEKQGQWFQAWEQVVRLARAQPQLWPVAAQEADRIVRRHVGADTVLSFGSRGLSPRADRMLSELGKTPSADLFVRSWSETIDVIHDSFGVEKSQGHTCALNWAFERANGHEIDALELLLARHYSTDEPLWTRFINRYLAGHSRSIRLEPGPSSERFNRIRANFCSTSSTGGPLVSVLMPVFNVGDFLQRSAASILDQSWTNLELILVDDASTDNSWEQCQAIAQRDPRVRLHRNAENVGPYVSKNIGLHMSRGEFITCHDADDWAFPDRIARQVRLLSEKGVKQQATSACMLRLTLEGEPTRHSRIGPLSEDGLSRRCFVSLMVRREHFQQHLGAWDNVRVSADSELMERAFRAPGGVLEDSQILLLCLDRQEGLTRDPILGIGEFRQDGPRATYQRVWRRWHTAHPDRLKLPVFPSSRPFPVKPELEVPRETLQRIYQDAGIEPTACPPTELPPEAETILDNYVVPRIHSKAMAKKPNPRHVLWEATEMLPHVGHEAALLYADRHLTSDLRYTLHILQANAALARGDEGSWLSFLNRYLLNFKLSPIRLQQGDSLLSRLAVDRLPSVDQGPLISVIMPAWNSENTVEHAARSILNQTWRPVELIIVDDASTDNTWSVLKRLAESDSRVRIRRNRVNVGPYVSKNIALTQATGQFVTGHDADDWAFPQRLEQHVGEVLASEGRLKATLNYMLRITPTGEVSKMGKMGTSSLDGAARLASISCLFDTRALRETLGYWDSVRFAADSEMIGRAEACFGSGFGVVRQIGMLCLDLETSLTNDPVHGIRSNGGGMADSRKNYRDGWGSWHKSVLNQENAFMPFPQKVRRYQAAADMVVPIEHQLLNLQG